MPNLAGSRAYFGWELCLLWQGVVPYLAASWGLIWRRVGAYFGGESGLIWQRVAPHLAGRCAYFGW